jgi:hypothetical protein
MTVINLVWLLQFQEMTMLINVWKGDCLHQLYICIYNWDFQELQEYRLHPESVHLAMRALSSQAESKKDRGHAVDKDQGAL